MKLKLDTIKTAVSKVTGRTGLKIQKYSPEILVVVGVVGIIGSTVLACKATLKLDAVLDATKVTVERIHVAVNTMDPEKYSEKDGNKDLFITYVQTAVKVGKLYAPAISLGILSIGSILYSYKILKGRNVALMMAYKGVEEAFLKYRNRVIADAGSEKDKEYKYGVKKVEQITPAYTDEDGKKHKAVNSTINVLDKDGNSIYARFFDELSDRWSKTPEYNLLFLKTQQSFCNDILNVRGHLFLNEVYRMLGIPDSQAGALVGWVKNNGDSFVDFNIYDEAFKSNREFVNGYEQAILLDFNVDGTIYDKI